MLKKEKGFTIIETLVAITILLMAVTGPMTLVKQGVVSARSSKDQIVAFYLAQDAVEYIRSVRDSNILSGAGNWLNGLAPCIGNGNQCKVDSVNNNISNCGGTCPLLQFNSGLYGYGAFSWVDTKYRRIVSITQINAEEILVEVEIKWDSDSKGFKIRDNLYKFQ